MKAHGETETCAKEIAWAGHNHMPSSRMISPVYFAGVKLGLQVIK